MALRFRGFLESPRLRFIAAGDTFQHQEKFQAWAWCWNENTRCWVNENETSKDAFAIRAIAHLPDIWIVCKGPVE